RALASRVEPLRCPLLQNHRSHGPEILAVFQAVQASLHAAVQRRGQYRTRAQRPRSELHAALEPPQDLFLRQQLGSLFGYVVQLAERQARPVQETFDFIVVVRRAQISVLHGPAARPTAPLLVDIERGAQRRAGVTRRRLHPYTLEWAIAAEPGVHD